MVAPFFIATEVKLTSDRIGRISGERLLSCILRWEPVFRGERRKWIFDRARLLPCIITRKEEFQMTNSKNLLKMNLTLEQISQATSLPLEKVQELEKECRIQN